VFRVLLCGMRQYLSKQRTSACAAWPLFPVRTLLNGATRRFDEGDAESFHEPGFTAWVSDVYLVACTHLVLHALLDAYLCCLHVLRFEHDGLSAIFEDAGNLFHLLAAVCKCRFVVHTMFGDWLVISTCRSPLAATMKMSRRGILDVGLRGLPGWWGLSSSNVKSESRASRAPLRAAGGRALHCSRRLL
jgi:hypothetical protein